MGRVFSVTVEHWAGIRVSGPGAATEVFGQATGDDAIPPALRRRMGRLERLAARCALGVLRDCSTDELVFCSRFGNLESVATLLGSLARRELLSPMLFSGSVHNALPGLIGQIKNEKLNHTAIAAGQETLRAGFIESLAQLSGGASRGVTLIYADLAMAAPPFEQFESETSPGVVLAMQLGRGGETGRTLSLASGPAGAEGLLEALRDGVRHIALEGVP